MADDVNKNNDIDEYLEDSLEKVEVDLRFMKAGSILVGTAFDKRGRKIKKASEPFTQQEIDKLLEKGIDKLYYIPEAPKTSIKDSLPTFHEKDYQPDEQTEIANKNIKQKQIDLRELIKKTYNKIKKEEPINIVLLKERLNTMLSEVLTKKKIMIQLLKTSHRDKKFSAEGLFTHSVNVATLSLLTAVHLRLKKEVIIDIALAGLLHDIGAIKLDKSIIDTAEELTQKELNKVKYHPAYTVDVLKRIEGIDKQVLLMTLQHHEHIDGSGYPKSLNGKDILPLSQIISVSEMYDTLVSDKAYCKAIEPEQAILYFFLTAGKHYHKKITHTLIRAVCERMRVENIFPRGSRVILNTNEIAIIQHNTEHMLRPQIEIVKDSKQQPVKHPIPVDLSREPQREIIRVLKLPSGESTMAEAQKIFKHFF